MSNPYRGPQALLVLAAALFLLAVIMLFTVGLVEMIR